MPVQHIQFIDGHLFNNSLHLRNIEEMACNVNMQPAMRILWSILELYACKCSVIGLNRFYEHLIERCKRPCHACIVTGEYANACCSYFDRVRFMRER